MHRLTGIDLFAESAARFQWYPDRPRTARWRSRGRPSSSCATTESEPEHVRILFFSHYFPPEVNAPANRTHEHCREWVAAGHEVHVVTCIPSHPFGRPFPGFRRRWYQYEEVDGIHVHRVWTYLAANRGVLRRTLNYLSFVPTAALRAWRLGRFDVAVGTSPQFFCAVATWAYTRLRRTPWVFELRDLWPESIPAVGAMRTIVRRCGCSSGSRCGCIATPLPSSA